MNKKVAVQELGIKDYKDTWDFQEEIFQEIVQQKSKNMFKKYTIVDFVIS